MKRYLLFVFDQYYPRGGWEDFWESFDEVSDAYKRAATRQSDHFHIVDSKTGQIIADDVLNPHVP